MAGLNDMLKAATDNMQLVAEAQLQLAAAGQVSIHTLGDNARALDFLTQHQKEAQRLAKEHETGTRKETKSTRDLIGAIKDFGSQATIAYAAASAGILSTIRAASPVAFDTFTQSMGLLSAEVGSVFLPIMVHVSNLIQDLAYWIEDLDDQTKDSILTWAEVGMATLGAMVAFQKIYSMGSMVIGVMNGIRIAGLALIATPWGVLLAALAAVAAAAMAIYFAFRDTDELARNLANNAQKYEEIAESGKPAGGSDLKGVLTAQEQERLVNAGKDQTKRKAVLQELYAKENRSISEEEVEKRSIHLRAGLQNLQKEFGETSIFNLRKQDAAYEKRETLLDKYFGRNDKLKDAVRAQLDMGPFSNIKGESIDAIVKTYEAKHARNRARNKVFGELTAEGAVVPDIAGNKKRPHLQALPREIQAQYQSFSGARQMFQIEALKKSPLEQEQLRIQRDSYARLQEISANTDATQRKLPIKVVGN